MESPETRGGQAGLPGGGSGAPMLALPAARDPLAQSGNACFNSAARVRMWRNWQTRYFEVVVEQSVQVRILPCAP